MSKLLINQQRKIISFILAIFLIFSVYIFLEYKIIKEEANTQFKKSLVLKYDIYLKMVENSKQFTSLLVENRDYVDNQELIEEYKKSMPLYTKELEKDIVKFELSFKYIEKNTKDEKLKVYISKLEEEHDDYFVKILDDNRIMLFGIVLDQGYVLVHQNTRDNKQALERVESFFVLVCIFFLISILFFFYMVSLKKNLSAQASDLHRNYELLSEETKKVAFEDTLTKAASRLKFDETLKDLIQIASRFDEQRFSVIMIDIDNFKSINDTFGHDYGDIVLKELARVTKLDIRASDTFARWGGEEFIIVCPVIDLKDACKIAEKLRRLISEIKFEKIDNITCSFGVVEFEKGDTEKSIIKRADELLYQAKENGKNRVEFKKA